MSQLHITPTAEAGVYSISGNITADADFGPLSDVSQSLIIFRFMAINEITSVGVKKWVEGVRALVQSGKTVEYHGCPELFVEQCNLVPEMANDVTIFSFQTTFICEDCDEEDLKMLQTKELDLENLPPSIICSSCNEEMITEDADVFKFITKH